MCYLEELFVQVDDEFVFLLVLRIPERLAYHMLFAETAISLKKSLNSEMMRLLRGIVATGDTNKHVHSKTFVYEISCRESQYKKVMPQIQVGQTTSSMTDKDFIVDVQLRENVFNEDTLLPFKSDSVKVIESPQIPTILEAASKKIDRSHCSSRTLSNQMANGKGDVEVGNEFLICRRKQKLSTSPSTAVATERAEVEVGEEFAICRRKRRLESPPTAIQVRDSAVEVEVEVGDEYAVRRKKPAAEPDSRESLQPSKETQAAESKIISSKSIAKTFKEAAGNTGQTASPKNTKSLVSLAHRDSTSSPSASEKKTSRTVVASRESGGESNDKVSRGESLSSDGEREPSAAKRLKTTSSTPVRPNGNNGTRNSAGGIRDFFSSLWKF